jgi:class 3 adenylate cyclase
VTIVRNVSERQSTPSPIAEDRSMDPTPSQDLMHQAMQSERLGRFEEARERLRRLIASDDPSGSLSLEARLRLGKLLIYGGTTSYAEAGEVLTAARMQAEQQGATRTAASAIHLLALLERYQRDLDRAQQLLDESPVARQASIPSPVRAQWLHYNGLIAADRGDLNGAERFYFRAHQVCRESNDKPGLAEVCDSLANLLLRRGKAGFARTFAEQSLELKKKLGDRYGEAISHGTSGRAYLLQARYEEAAAEFEEDLRIVREVKASGEGIMLNSLGEVALLRKDHAGAEDFYRKALAIEAGPSHAVHSRLGLARVLLARRRLAEACRECDEAQTILGANPGLPGLTIFLRGMRGALAWREGDLVAGERQLDETIEALKSVGYSLDTIPLLYELRDLYQSQGSRAKAVEVMGRALNLLNQCGSERGVQDVEDWLRTVDTPNLVRLALEQYIPEWLVTQFLDGHLKRPPTRTQELAVLFSDIRGYTTLTQGLGAEQIVEFLNEWFSEATRAIRRHNGVVDKFIGDAVMALFGVPHEDPAAASDAVKAALEMRDALEAMNMRQKALDRPEIRVGIGIACGPAVVGFIGSHLRQSYTAIGDVVNTASRLESATKEQDCDILITAAVEAVQQQFGVAETHFVGKLELKGRSHAEPVFKVLGARGTAAL